MTEVFLSIGSNIDREHNILSSLRELALILEDMKISSIYESEAVGFDGDNFFNLVVQGKTHDDLATLSTRLKQIEDEHGRERVGSRFSGRTLDIDIVLFGDLVGRIDGIELPRAELYSNAFVLKPMAELVPERIDPKTGSSFAKLWQDSGILQKLWIVDLTVQ